MSAKVAMYLCNLCFKYKIRFEIAGDFLYHAHSWSLARKLDGR